MLVFPKIAWCHRVVGFRIGVCAMRVPSSRSEVERCSLAGCVCTWLIYHMCVGWWAGRKRICDDAFYSFSHSYSYLPFDGHVSCNISRAFLMYFKIVWKGEIVVITALQLSIWFRAADKGPQQSIEIRWDTIELSSSLDWNHSMRWRAHGLL